MYMNICIYIYIYIYIYIFTFIYISVRSNHNREHNTQPEQRARSWISLHPTTCDPLRPQRSGRPNMSCHGEACDLLAVLTINDKCLNGARRQKRHKAFTVAVRITADGPTPQPQSSSFGTARRRRAHQL